MLHPSINVQEKIAKALSYELVFHSGSQINIFAFWVWSGPSGVPGFKPRSGQQGRVLHGAQRELESHWLTWACQKCKKPVAQAENHPALLK